MRSRNRWIVGILVLTFALIPAASFSAEHGGAGTAEHGGAGTAEHGGATTAAPAATATQPAPEAAQPVAPAPDLPAAPPAPAPEAAPPVPVPPALKPIVITFSGDLASVDSAATPAMVTVKDRYGVTKEISITAETKIAQGTEAKALADLKAGETKVTVEYTYDVATGKRTAQSIAIGEAAVPASR